MRFSGLKSGNKVKFRKNYLSIKKENSPLYDICLLYYIKVCQRTCRLTFVHIIIHNIMSSDM